MMKLLSNLLRCAFAAVVSTVLAGHALADSPWFPLGPYGGDARAFASDPTNLDHLFMGTANGWLYESGDAGKSWSRMAQIEHRNDLVIAHIVVNPQDSRRMLIGAYAVDHPDGGIYVSDDGGHSWVAQAQMHRKSVRSLTRAIQDAGFVVAGTLDGVYRSTDFGRHWSQISPAGSVELHEIESIAIDPANDMTIYAGTWHLPWKTTDGGAHWSNITSANGFIDDSDVFSIIIDPLDSRSIYASACSGIYKSVDGASRFNKIQGIPSTARRTRRLLQDPVNRNTVYAGTTEGLYKTTDAGAHFSRVTGPEVIVNDIYIDPRNAQHVLLATDRGGVLISDDGAATFRSSNLGFTARLVTSYAADPHNPSQLYIGVVNDKQLGGVFSSQDGGVHWVQSSAGLNGLDVYALATLEDSTLVAGTSHGIWQQRGGVWSGGAVITETVKLPAPRTPAAKTSAARAKASAPATKTVTHPIAGPVYALASVTGTLYAGTQDGLLRADSTGSSWTKVASGLADVRYVGGADETVLIADVRRLALSTDGGVTFSAILAPAELTHVLSVAVDGQKTLWVGGREGVWVSADHGATWRVPANLRTTQVDCLYYDAAAHRMIVTSSLQPYVYSVFLPDYHVTYMDSGWHLRFARPVGDHMIGATLFDGMVLQPKMVVK